MPACYWLYRSAACWSRWRAAAHAACAPLLVGLVLLRAGRDAIRSGWLLGYLATLPLQALGQVAWSLGETRAQYRHPTL